MPNKMNQADLIFNIIDAAHEGRNEDPDAKIRRSTPCFVGPSEVGKSSIAWKSALKIRQRRLEEEGEDFSFGVKELQAANWEHPCDLLGHPESKEDEAFEKKVTDYNPHRWFHEINQFDEGILIIDELLNMRPNCHDTAKQFILYGELEEYKIPDSWTIITITNPPSEDDDYMVWDIDESFRSRLVWVPITNDRDAYLEHLEESEYDPHVEGFIKENPGIFNWEKDQEIPYKIEPGPRRAELFDIMYDPGLSDKVTFYIAQGTLGKEIATQFNDYRDRADLERISPEDILENYPDKRKRMKKLIESGENYDQVNSLAEQVVAYLESEKSDGVNLNTYRSYLNDFLSDLPNDMAYSYVDRIEDIDDEIVDTGQFEQTLQFGSD